MYGKSLAHIEKVKSVEPIAGADNIEKVTVLDWTLIAKKGEFVPGDKALYIEIGSILPDGLSDEQGLRYAELKKIKDEYASREKLIAKAMEKGLEMPKFEETLMPLAEVEKEMEAIQATSAFPYFEFLRAKKFKIKTMVLKKFDVISQGILFRPEVVGLTPDEAVVGADFTERFKITEIVEDDEEAGVSATASKNPIIKFIDKKLMRYAWYRNWKKSRSEKADWFAEFPGKSDEENAQKVFSKMYELYRDEEWVVTEKLEGQNITLCTEMKRGFFGKLKKKLFVCSRTRNLPYKGCSSMQFWKTVKSTGFGDKVMDIEGEWFVRGEHLGEGIQKNIYMLPKHTIRFFDVNAKDETTGKFSKKLNYEETVEFLKKYDLPMVPIIDDHYKLPPTVKELLEYSNGKTVFGKNPKQIREGVVLRLRKDYNVSFKVKNPYYSLKDN